MDSERIAANPTYLGVLTKKIYLEDKVFRAIQGLDLNRDSILEGITYPACTFTIISSETPTNASSLNQFENRLILAIHIALDSTKAKFETLVSFSETKEGKTVFKMKNLSNKKK